MRSNLARMQMEREGYRNISDQEVELYSLVGSKMFYNVVDSAFRIGYWVDKYFELGDEETRLTYVNNRREMVGYVLQMARKGQITYTPLSDGELAGSVRNSVQELVKKARGKAIHT